MQTLMLLIGGLVLVFFVVRGIQAFSNDLSKKGKKK